MTAPDYLIAGQSVVVECKSGPSNPQAVIEWDVRDIKDVREDENMEVKSIIAGQNSTYDYKGSVILNLLDRLRLGDHGKVALILAC